MAGPQLRGSGQLHIVGRDDVMTISDPDGAVHRLLGLTDGSHTKAQIVSVLASEFPLLGEHDVEHVLCELQTIGLLEDCSPLEEHTLASPTWLSEHHQRTLLARRASSL
jgi:hypothetical protein